MQEMHDLEEQEAGLNTHPTKPTPHNNPVPLSGGAKEEGSGGVLADGKDEVVEEDVDSYEPSQVDDRFRAIYTDPEYALDPSHTSYSFIKGRSHVAQKKYADLKRLMTRDRQRHRLEPVVTDADKTEGEDEGDVHDLVARAKAANERVSRLDEEMKVRASNLVKGETVEKQALRDLWGSSSEVTKDVLEHDVLDSPLALDGAGDGQDDKDDGDVSDDLSLLDPSLLSDSDSAKDLPAASKSAKTKAAKEKEWDKMNSKERLLVKKSRKKDKEKEVSFFDFGCICSRLRSPCAIF